MKIKYSTTQPKDIVSDHELCCQFCRKNDRQEDMTYTTGRTSSGQKLRRVFHRRCMREYRQKLRERNKSLACPAIFRVEFKDDTKPVIFKPKDTILQKLINSF